jgi:hypothetical protein
MACACGPVPSFLDGGARKTRPSDGASSVHAASPPTCRRRPMQAAHARLTAAAVGTPRTVALRNAGTAALSGLPISFIDANLGSYERDGGPCATTLASGATCKAGFRLAAGQFPAAHSAALRAQGLELLAVVDNAHVSNEVLDPRLILAFDARRDVRRSRLRVVDLPHRPSRLRAAPRQQQHADRRWPGPQPPTAPSGVEPQLHITPGRHDLLGDPTPPHTCITAPNPGNVVLPAASGTVNPRGAGQTHAGPSCPGPGGRDAPSSHGTARRLFPGAPSGRVRASSSKTIRKSPFPPS